jgi:N-acetylglutamate synthase-like GNAT family acetyltransferase
MKGLDIRLARPDDRDDLIELQRRASLASEGEEVRRQLLDNPDIIDLDPEMIARNEVFVAEVGTRIVGFATIIAHEGDDTELEGIFVEPSEWRQGIGTALLRQIEREAQAWGASRLHVVASRNTEAFYAREGFEAIGEQKTPLGPVALLMVAAGQRHLGRVFDVGADHLVGRLRPRRAHQKAGRMLAHIAVGVGHSGRNAHDVGRRDISRRAAHHEFQHAIFQRELGFGVAVAAHGHLDADGHIVHRGAIAEVVDVVGNHRGPVAGDHECAVVH